MRVAAPPAPAEDVNTLDRIIRARRSKLHNRRELDTPGQINQAAYDPAMTLVIGRRAVIVLRKNVVEVGRSVAESRRVTIVGDRAREHVVGVEAEAMAQATAVREIH